MLKQVILAKFVSVNKETETSTVINNEVTEEPDEVYEELDSELQRFQRRKIVCKNKKL